MEIQSMFSSSDDHQKSTPTRLIQQYNLSTIFSDKNSPNIHMTNNGEDKCIQYTDHNENSTEHDEHLTKNKK